MAYADLRLEQKNVRFCTLRENWRGSIYVRKKMAWEIYVLAKWLTYVYVWCT